MLAGEKTRWTPSMKIGAPAGVVVTGREPVVAASAVPAAPVPAGEDPAGEVSDADPTWPVPVDMGTGS